MRCLACGAEMKLIEVVRDDTMMVPGYEDQTFECLDCHEIDRRRVFRGEGTVSAGEPTLPPAPGLQAPIPEVSTITAAAASATAPSETTTPFETAVPIAAAATAAAEPDIVPLHAAPPASPAGDGEEQVDEGEEMLRCAIAMVRTPVRGSQPIRGLTDGVRAPTALAGAVKAKKADARRVQIRHDPSYDPAYAAKDVKTGLVVLRHPDSIRLRSMCDRLGWQVVEDGSVVED